MDVKVTGAIWKLKKSKENLPLRSVDFHGAEFFGGFNSSRYEKVFSFELPATDKCKHPLAYVYDAFNGEERPDNEHRIRTSDVVVITSPLFESGAFYKNSVGWKALKDLWKE